MVAVCSTLQPRCALFREPDDRKERLMKRLVLTLATVALFGCVSPAQATSITYTEMFTATGTLGGIPFTNALVTLTMTGDTSDIVGGDTFFYMVAPLAVNVADVWTATFTDTI